MIAKCVEALREPALSEASRCKKRPQLSTTLIALASRPTAKL